MTEPRTEKRYRLRFGTEVVGYLRTYGKRRFFSKDGFWWTGMSIVYTDTDSWSGWRDWNRKPLYVRDVVEVRRPGEQSEARFEVREESADRFVLASDDQTLASFPDSGWVVECVGRRLSDGPE